MARWKTEKQETGSKSCSRVRGHGVFGGHAKRLSFSRVGRGCAECAGGLGMLCVLKKNRDQIHHAMLPQAGRRINRDAAHSARTKSFQSFSPVSASRPSRGHPKASQSQRLSPPKASPSSSPIFHRFWTASGLQNNTKTLRKSIQNPSRIS